MNTYEEIKKLAQEIIASEELTHSQIPNIELYIDQITTFMDDNLAKYTRDPKDKIMTKTMVNNYTKDKLLPPPNKKKYSKYHVILLILIFHLKQSLTIVDIQKLINSIPKKDASLLYEAFTSLHENEKDILLSSVIEKQAKVEEKIKELELSSQDNKTQALLMALSLIIDANNKKQLACKIIDEYFKSV